MSFSKKKKKEKQKKLNLVFQNPLLVFATKQMLVFFQARLGESLILQTSATIEP